jgi:hypothetical protein
MAERVGFEPTLEFPLNTLSKRAPSATRPSLRRFQEATAVGWPIQARLSLEWVPLVDSMVLCAVLQVEAFTCF